MSRELLFSVTKKDFRIDKFRCGKKGGQHANKVESGIRITHIPSGAVGESRNHKSQHANKKAAFSRILDDVKWKTWHARMVNEMLSGKTIEEKVNDQMKEENVVIEVRDDKGKWVNIQ